MFLTKVKDFLLKNSVKKRLDFGKQEVTNKTISVIGILLNESLIQSREKIIQDVLKRGFDSSNVHVLVFKKSIRKEEVYPFPIFSMKDIGWDSSVKSAAANQFLSRKYDVLINAFADDITPLRWISVLAKSDFRVGFSGANALLNQLMIETDEQNTTVFIDELFKYLKILNKIK